MQSFNSYNIDFKKLAAWLTPKPLRKINVGLTVKALLFPLTFIHTAFSNYRQAKLYQLKITPQVCYLERLLNDRFDYTLRRIRIVDAVWHLPLFIYREDELKTLNVYKESEAKPVIVYSEGEVGSALNDFIVLVPVGLSFSQSEMKALLDNYKLFGTKYTIQTI